MYTESASQAHKKQYSSNRTRNYTMHLTYHQRATYDNGGTATAHHHALQNCLLVALHAHQNVHLVVQLNVRFVAHQGAHPNVHVGVQLVYLDGTTQKETGTSHAPQRYMCCTRKVQ